MAQKKAAWFGPYSLKQLGGIPSFTARLVDERTLNWATLEPYKPWLAVVDAHTGILEFCGNLVPLYEMDMLLAPIILVQPVKPVAEETAPVPVPEKIAVIPAVIEKVVVPEKDAETVPELTITKAETKKAGRKKKEAQDSSDFKFDF